MRLNYGPFEHADSKVAIERTRLQFLWNARARLPGITQDLFDNCYPLYLACRKISPSWAAGWTQVKASKQTRNLSSQLNEWSRRHLLVAGWCNDRALGAMNAWTADEEARQFLSWCKEPEIARYLLFPQFYPSVSFSAEHLRDLRWSAKQVGILSFGPDEEVNRLALGSLVGDYTNVSHANEQLPEPPQGYERWWPSAVSKEEYLRDVEHRAKEIIRSDSLLASVEKSHQSDYVRQIKLVALRYCRSVERHLSKRPGWRKSKVFSGHRTHLRHVVWAVMFQLEGKSYSQIAAAMETEFGRLPAVSTIKRGVSEILDLIALDMDRRSEVRRGPKVGSFHSNSTKTRSAILRSLGS